MIIGLLVWICGHTCSGHHDRTECSTDMPLLCKFKQLQGAWKRSSKKNKTVAAAWPFRWIGRRWWRWRTSDLAAAVSQPDARHETYRTMLRCAQMFALLTTKRQASTTHQYHKLGQTTAYNGLQVTVYLATFNKGEGSLPSSQDLVTGPFIEQLNPVHNSHTLCSKVYVLILSF